MKLRNLKSVHCRHRHAFTLTETVIVLGVVGLVLSGVWVAAASIYQQRHVLTTVQQIETAARNFRRLNQGRTNSTSPSGTDLSTSVGPIIFPQDAVGIWNGGVPWGINQWGDGWRVVIGRGNDMGGGAASGDQAHFYFYSGSVPYNICSQVVMQLAQADATSILIYNSSLGWGGWAAPSTITAANSKCWPFGNSGAVGVEFSFK